MKKLLFYLDANKESTKKPEATNERLFMKKKIFLQFFYHDKNVKDLPLHKEAAKSLLLFSVI